MRPLCPKKVALVPPEGATCGWGPGPTGIECHRCGKEISFPTRRYSYPTFCSNACRTGAKAPAPKTTRRRHPDGIASACFWCAIAGAHCGHGRSGS